MPARLRRRLKPVKAVKFDSKSTAAKKVTLSKSSLDSQADSCNVTLCDAVKEQCTQLQHVGPISVYKIPLVRWNSFGEESNKQNRTIILLGQTGSGKSTLINGMINYILGVEWECPYRFQLVHEDPSKSQAESQTSEVTVYKINHQEGFKIDYSVTIVDTPGFGDTRGIERDRAITEQLRNLFSSRRGVGEIDAVCVVAQASLPRLTATQRYVFDSVLSIFGKDIAENIRVLVTFADGQRPPVLEAIKAAGVPCPKTKTGLPIHFKFNNSAADSMGGNSDEMFWDMGTHSMKRFFDDLSEMETNSLTMTTEVLRKRKQLESLVKTLQEQVQEKAAKHEEIERLTDREDRASMDRFETFVFKSVLKGVQEEVSGPGNSLSVCKQCHYTCHAPCRIPNDVEKNQCWAIRLNGYCDQCPGRCHWTKHTNQTYKWESEEVQTHHKNQRGHSRAETQVEQVIQNLRDKYDVLQAEIEKAAEKAAECLNRLSRIQLCPDPLSAPEYIDVLVEAERSEAKPGWSKRVQSLMDQRGKAEIMAELDRETSTRYSN